MFCGDWTAFSHIKPDFDLIVERGVDKLVVISGVEMMNVETRLLGDLSTCQNFAQDYLSLVGDADRVALADDGECNLPVGRLNRLLFEESEIQRCVVCQDAQPQICRVLIDGAKGWDKNHSHSSLCRINSSIIAYLAERI